MERLHQAQQYLDEKAKAKVDPHYIEVPDKPWRVVLRYKESVFDVDYSNVAGDPSAGDGAEYEMCIEPPLACGQAIVVREYLLPSLSVKRRKLRSPSAPPGQSTVPTSA